MLWQLKLGKRFFTGKMTASHCQCGSRTERQAALHQDGKRRVHRLAASVVVVVGGGGARLGRASCLLCGSDGAGLGGGTLRRCPAAICQEESREIFPTDGRNFTTVCCKKKKQLNIARSHHGLAHVCLERALKIMFEVVLR